MQPKLTSQRGHTLQELLGADYGSGLELFEGTDCDHLNYLACYNSTGTFFINQLTPGKTYYLRWVSVYYSAHSFQICLNHYKPPVNDACAGALPLTVHGNMDCYYSTHGTTAGSIPGQPAGCTNKADVWFRFKAIQTTQRIVISGIKSVEDGSFQPLAAELLTGNCDNLNSLYCWTAKSVDPITLFIGDLTPGQTYYLRLASPSDLPVEFDVCVLTPPKPPANDNCSQATMLTPAPAGGDCTYTDSSTGLSTPTPGLPLPPGPAEGDVWYAFNATQTDHVVSIRYVYGYPYYQAIVEVYASACAPFDLVVKQEIYYSGDINLTNLIPGTTYYIRILPESTPTITFSICVSTPPAPSNDACANALPLPVNSNYICYNSLAVNTYGATQSQPACDGSSGTDIWYQFTATDATYRFEINGNSSPDNGGGVEVLYGDCGNLTSLFCRAFPTLPTIVQEGGFVPGQTYYVRFWGKANTVQQLSVCTYALPPVPANDDCAHAQSLITNSSPDCASTTSGTTLSAHSGQSDCAGTTVQDVWYTFTATAKTYFLKIDNVANYFGTYYGGFELLSGDCATPVAFICRNSIYGDYQELLQDLTPGQTYFLRFFNYNMGAEDFSICLTALPVPPNDDCANAQTVTANPDLHCSVTYLGTTGGANPDDSSTPPDVWYTFTANSDALYSQLLNVQQIYGPAANLQYQLYHGSDCDHLQLVDTYYAYDQNRLAGLTTGDTYFIRVFPLDVNAAFIFELCLQTPPPPPSNVNCAHSLPLIPNTGLDCDLVTHGSTGGAVSDYPYACYSSGPLYNVWYSFTATSSVHIIRASNIVALTSAGDNLFEFDLLQSADCVNFTSIGCGYFDQAITIQGLIPGQVYYVVAVSRKDVLHEFDLCVTSYPIPANDGCANATELAVLPGPDCDNSTTGTTLGATNSDNTGCGAGTSDVWYTFTATQAAHIITVYSAADPLAGWMTYFDLEVLQNGCDHLQSLFCSASQYASTQLNLGELTPGSQYWVRISGHVHFSICVSTPPVPPVNDGCTGAIALAVSSDEHCASPTSGSTEFATATNLNYLPDGGNAADVWYTFTATQASHAVLLNDLSNSLSVALYSGTCGTLKQVDLQLYSLNGHIIWLTTQLTPGETYYIRIVNIYYYNSSTFDVCVISPPAPPNDACMGAIELLANADLSCPSTPTFSTLGATQSAPGCTGDAADDVWFRFTATTDLARLEINPLTYGSSGKYGVEIMEGDCVAPAIVFPCTEYNDNQSSLSLHVVAGHKYYLRLHVPPTDVKDFSICLRNLPPVPANDECAQATVIQAGSGVDCGPVYNGTTLSASQSGTTCNGGESDDVWYQFTATSTGHIIRIKSTGYPFGNQVIPGMEIYSGNDCASFQSISCYDYLDGSDQILNGLTVGGSYFIRVYTYKGSPVNFSLCLGTLPSIPANSSCDGAIEVIPSPDKLCSQPVAGTTAGLMEVSSQGCYTTTSLWYHFKATSHTHFIQLQNVVPQYGNPFLRMGLAYGGCSYPQFLYCTDGQEILATNLTPGGDYYIMVGGMSNSGTRFDLCVLTPAPPPDNDNCFRAVTLTVSPTVDCLNKVSGNNLGATGSYSIFSCYDGPDVWYAFTASSATQQVNFSNVHLTNGHAYVELLEGDCDDWVSEKACYYFYQNTTQLLNDLEPGKTYYLRVGSTFISYFSFDICLVTPQPDLDIQTIQTSSNGCQPGNNESIEVSFVNRGSGSIAEKAAQFTLTVSGANNGTYGPVGNPTSLDYYSYGVLTFTGVDLSNPGDNQLLVTAIVPNELNPADNSETQTFSSLPLLIYYRDADGDGYGDKAEHVESCFPLAGYVADNTDCDDTNDQVHPGATEICNGMDDNCNSLIDAADPDIAGAPLPDVVCPNAITVANDPGTCSALVHYTVTTSDNCGYTLTQTGGLGSGESFPVGSTINTFTVSGSGGQSASCSFTVTVQKTADPDLLNAYTVIGLNDVLLKNNTVQTGGIGLVNAGKKARLQGGTVVSASNTFVKAPILELLDGSLVTTSYTGQVPVGLLPAFQSNTTPSSNNLTIPNNGAPVTLALGSYGNVIIGINASVTFAGPSTVLIKELTIKDGATVSFAQNTDLLVNKGITIAKNVVFNPGGSRDIQCFAGENVTIDRSTHFSASLYTQKNLLLAKAAAAAPTVMTGTFIASNVNAQDFVVWNWDARCPFDPGVNRTATTEDRSDLQSGFVGRMQISPNPATTSVRVQFNLDTDAEVTLQLMDVSGRLVQTSRFGGMQGENQYWLELGDLTEGVYGVQLQAEERLEMEKVVVLKR
jgi:hypothetical protein